MNYNKSAFSRAITIGILVFAVPIAAEEISVTEDNAEVLVGKWKGSVRATSGGSTRWSSAVTLEIYKAGGLQGEFTLKSRQTSWVTEVDIDNGLVVMSFGHAPREFVLEKKRSSHRLEAKYDAEWEGQMHKYTLSLKKK